MRLVCIDAPETSQYIEGCDRQTYSHLYKRSRVYELARIANPNRWSRSIRCWKQPDLVWINEPLATEQTSLQVTLAREI